MPLPRDKAWFAAKTHGYGWGWPLRWQGWVVLIGFVVLGTVGSQWLPPNQHPLGFVGGIFGLSSALVIICWRTGETPRWRWGNDDQ